MIGNKIVYSGIGAIVAVIMTCLIALYVAQHRFVTKQESLELRQTITQEMDEFKKQIIDLRQKVAHFKLTLTPMPQTLSHHDSSSEPTHFSKPITSDPSIPIETRLRMLRSKNRFRYQE